MPEWVPTSERMPPYENVLVCSQRSGYRLPHIVIGWYDEPRQEWRAQGGWRVEGTVTHWMRLPPVPSAP